MRELVVFAALLIALASCQTKIGSDSDSHGCISSAGYTWCQTENKCVRAWEVANQQNLDGTRAQFDSYCNGTLTPKIGSGKDEHNCITSAGYSWCESENACVRPWEIARQKGLDGSKRTFDAYCSGQTSQTVGGVKDANGCLVGAGFTWCATENQCVQPWQLAKEKNLDASQASFSRYCTSGQISLPGSTDANGCHRGTGYTWCPTESRCVRPWEVARQQNLDGTRAAFDSYCGNKAQTQPIGGTQDPNGCLTSAGYTWCAAESKCVRPWELSRQKNLDGTRVQFDEYCAGDVQLTQPIGGASDQHGCMSGAGYTWCAAENDCVRPWELARARGFDLSTASFATYCAGQNPTPAVGSDADGHGCVPSAGYTWCPAESKCVRVWELAHQKSMSILDAQAYCS